MKTILKTAICNALATALYIAIIGSCIFYSGEHKMGQIPTPFIPIFMLMLFVFSAALTGTLFFGKPIMWYIDGKKKEALSLLAYTFGAFFIIGILVFTAMLLASTR